MLKVIKLMFLRVFVYKQLLFVNMHVNALDKDQAKQSFINNGKYKEYRKQNGMGIIKDILFPNLFGLFNSNSFSS